MENLYIVKGYGAKSLLKYKGWGLRGLNKLLKKLQNWHDDKTKRQHRKHTEYLLFFLFCNIP